MIKEIEKIQERLDKLEKLVFNNKVSIAGTGKATQVNISKISETSNKESHRDRPKTIKKRKR
jgi:hypothetical protein